MGSSPHRAARAVSPNSGTREDMRGQQRTMGAFAFVRRGPICGPYLHSVWVGADNKRKQADTRPFRSPCWAKFFVEMTQTDKIGPCIEVAPRVGDTLFSVIFYLPVMYFFNGNQFFGVMETS